jgi:hypothetical protein
MARIPPTATASSGMGMDACVSGLCFVCRAGWVSRRATLSDRIAARWKLVIILWLAMAAVLMRECLKAGVHRGR